MERHLKEQGFITGLHLTYFIKHLKLNHWDCMEMKNTLRNRTSGNYTSKKHLPGKKDEPTAPTATLNNLFATVGPCRVCKPTPLFSARTLKNADFKNILFTSFYFLYFLLFFLDSLASQKLLTDVLRGKWRQGGRAPRSLIHCSTSPEPAV